MKGRCGCDFVCCSFDAAAGVTPHLLHTQPPTFFVRDGRLSMPGLEWTEWSSERAWSLLSDPLPLNAGRAVSWLVAACGESDEAKEFVVGPRGLNAPPNKSCDGRSYNVWMSMPEMENRLSCDAARRRRGREASSSR